MQAEWRNRGGLKSDGPTPGALANAATGRHSVRHETAGMASATVVDRPEADFGIEQAAYVLSSQDDRNFMHMRQGGQV